MKQKYLSDEQCDRRVKICELLGANKFQKIVFRVENLKYKTIRKFFPNYLSYIDKYYDKRKNRLIENVNSSEQIKEIEKRIQLQKMLARKEFNYSKNRNYHIDWNRPTEFVNYLKWNKKIHINGLKKGLVFLGIIILLFYSTPFLIPLISCNLFSIFINFECINIQNSNIYRLEKPTVKEKIKKLEELKLKQKVKKYAECSKTVSKILDDNNSSIPTIEEVLKNSNIQARKELADLARKEFEKRKALKLR